ncbi:MAG: response regulator [Patescibacteria group bacterium]|nr:response regulator [Patescibacteria group bacterium]MDD5567379.1 response regulator [Patescibacteria group bacterium]
MAADKRKILLVEDEKMLSSMYATKFAKEGYELIQAYDGEEGLTKAKSIKPDVILLDIIMPKLDGFVVLKALKQDPELKKIPVILLTNLGQDEDIRKGKELGADDYFIKANHTPAEVVDKAKAFFEK